MGKNLLQIEHCISVNFGYFDKLSLPHINITPESKIQFIFDTSIACFVIIIGGDYLDKVGEVMEKVNTNYIVGKRPLAVFLISKSHNERLKINVNYGFDRLKSTPVMVRIQNV